MIKLGYVILVLSLVAIVPVFISICYLFLLTLFSLIPRKRDLSGEKSCKFAILIYASNAEGKIENLVSTLIADLDYPKELFDVIVIADNCDDSTQFLSTFAGAKVLEYKNEWKSGEGNAIEWGLGKLKKSGYDAFLILDVDAILDSSALSYLAASVERGARAMQLSIKAVVPDAKSWADRFFDIELASNVHLRSRGRNNMGLSCRMGKSGICFTQALLNEIPIKSADFFELQDYQYNMIENDEKIEYVSPAEIATLCDSKVQDIQYEKERKLIKRKITLKMLKESLNWNCSAFDVICEELIPALKTMFAAICVTLVAGTLLFASTALFSECAKLMIPSLVVLSISLLCFIMLLSYIFVGMLEHRVPFKTWLLILFFPIVAIIVSCKKCMHLFRGCTKRS